jgi:hypothetical protein
MQNKENIFSFARFICLDKKNERQEYKNKKKRIVSSAYPRGRIN